MKSLFLLIAEKSSKAHAKILLVLFKQIYTNKIISSKEKNHPCWSLTQSMTLGEHVNRKSILPLHISLNVIALADNFRDCARSEFPKLQPVVGRVSLCDVNKTI